MTHIQRCSCVSAFQDRRYGLGKRLHNLLQDSKDARCTVCGVQRATVGGPKK